MRTDWRQDMWSLSQIFAVAILPILLGSTSPQQSPSAATPDDSKLALYVDGVKVEVGAITTGLDGYLVPVAPAVKALTHGHGQFRRESGDHCSIWIDGRLAVRLPYGGVNPQPIARIFGAESDEVPVRQLKLRGVPEDSDSEGGGKTPVIDLETLGAIFGVGMDIQGTKIAALTPGYWAKQLDLNEESAKAVEVNPLRVVPDFGITPPAQTLMVWVRPAQASYVQIYRLSDGIPRAMLGINPVTRENVTAEESDLKRARLATPTQTVRAESMQFESRIGRSGRYAAIVTTKDPGPLDPREAIEKGVIKPGEYAVVGLSQRITANPARFDSLVLGAKETLTSFARRERLDIDLLLLLNGLHQGDTVTPGTHLIVVKAPQVQADDEGVRPAGTYLVAVNDTLASLAKKWGVTSDQLLAANPSIVVGTELIPGDLIQKVTAKAPGLPPPPVVSHVLIGSGRVQRDTPLRSAFNSGKTVCQLMDGMTVTVLAEVPGGKGYKVQLNDAIGFVAKGDLKVDLIQSPVAKYNDALVGAPPAQGGSRIVMEALKFLGTPYKWGGNSLNEGIDCSHFVAAVYDRAGVPCPPPPVATMERTPIVHYKQPNGLVLRGSTIAHLPPRQVPLSVLRPGDRIIIQRGLTGTTGSRHTGIYAGNIAYRGHVFRNAVIHAGRPGVRIDELTGPYLWPNYVFTVRGEKITAERANHNLLARSER